MATILFFDDWFLDSYDHIRWVQAPDLYHGQTIFNDPIFPAGCIYPSIIYDEPQHLWRAFYLATGDAATDQGVGLFTAESADGIHWQIPDLRSIAPEVTETLRHRVLAGRHNVQSGQVYYDSHENDPSKRFKILFLDTLTSTPHNTYAFSPDGYRWTLAPQPWGNFMSDTCTSIFFNRHTGGYQAVVRPRWGCRIIGMIETLDFQEFSKPRCILRPGPEDPPLTQFYGMPTFPYEDNFVGFLWLMKCDPEDIGIAKSRGNITSQLTYSYDGWCFNRCRQIPLIEPGSAGGPEYLCIYPSSMVVDQKTHQIHVYSYSAYGGHQDNPTPKTPGLMTRHDFRLDGFVGVENIPSCPGTILTRMLRLKEPGLKLNIMARHGRITAQWCEISGTPIEGFTFNECIPVEGDQYFGELGWKSGDWRKILHRPVKLALQLNEAHLYAVRFSGEILDYYFQDS